MVAIKKHRIIYSKKRDQSNYALNYSVAGGTKHYINLFLLWIYVFNTVFIPYDDFMLKKISYVLLLILNMREIINGCRLTKENLVIILFGIMLPLYTIIKSAIITHEFLSNFMSGYTGMILLLYFVINKYKINFIHILNLCLFALSLLICISAFLDLIGVISVLSNPILQWLYDTSNANIGKGTQYISGYYIFIKTSPMLLVGLGYHIQNKKYVSAIIFTFALILSGTRANAILAILVFGIGLLVRERTIKRQYLMFLIVISIGVVVLVGTSGVDRFIEFNASKSSSDMVRERTVPSIIKSWKDNPLSFITGQGYSGEFYNYGRKTFNADSELSYWNLLRRVGIFCFVLIIGCYLYPIWSNRKSKNMYSIVFAYIAYLVGCYVNPLLYTSTGVTVLLYMLCF